MTRWRLRDPASLRWRQWDDQYVLHHVPSGDTHLADGALGSAVLALRDGPRSIAELSEGDADTGAHLAESFARLAEAGVLERVP